MSAPTEVARTDDAAGSGAAKRAPVLLTLRTKPEIPASAKATCHGPGGGVGAGSQAPVIALVGAPNVGKSTLFNALTGSRVTMGNWPGTTVGVSRGIWRTTVEHRTCDCEVCTCPPSRSQDLTLIDLPGTYSIDPMSPDEALTRDLLVSGPEAERPDLTIVTADAANLARSLYIVSQLRERGGRLIVALTMLDVAASRGLEIDTAALSNALGCPVVPTDPRRRRGIDELTRQVHASLDAEPLAPRELTDAPVELSPLDADLHREDERFTFIEDAVERGTHHSGTARVTLTDKVDRWVTAPMAGPLIFLAVMWLVFQITTTVAAPMQDALDSLFSGPVSQGVHWLLSQIGLGQTWVNGLIVDGLIAGVGMLLTFAPLMALMFVLLALLEDSGYMARAAVVTDRLMRTLGLPGRAFLPLVVGFGCNVPAISATRILPNVRQRILTALLVPFTSCTARLTVYVLVGTTFFGRWAGTVVFAMYLTSILFVVGVGFLLRKTLWRTMGTEPLVLDLPAYQRPTVRLTASVAWLRLKGFLRTASGIIVATVCLVWLAQAIPVDGHSSFGNVPTVDSLYGFLARAIAPIFSPAGFAAWQTVSALVVGFVAKEAVISSWAQTYAVAQPSGADPGSLGQAIKSSFELSSNGHTIPAVLAFLVFLLAYTPCVATLAAQKREIGVRWTIFGVAMQLTVAWLAAVLVFQVGKVFW